MSWVKFSLAVAATSLALVIALAAAGTFVVGNAFASAAQSFAGPAMSHDWNIPPELASLKDVPDSQKFSHFKGVTANLTDKDGKPITITVTPGVATNVSTNSITLNGNDGATHTYAIDANTMNTRSTPASGANVVVITLNNSQTATAVFSPDNNAWHGRGGPPFNR